jgi:pyrroloquinoline quinone (PQQ) biosynthesis protein C
MSEANQKYFSAIQEIAQSTRRHRALNNAFYDTWLKRRLTLPEAERYAHNYYAWIATVPDQIARVFIATGDFEAKCETVKNLFSEMGFGNPEKTHLHLLKNFLTGILSKLHGSEYQWPAKAALLPSTQALIDAQMELFGNPQPQIAAGALMAQEWQAYSMLVQLYEGARLYAPLWTDPEGFHEICEYLYIHIGDAEKEHKVQSINTALAYVKSDSDLELLRMGHSRFLNALANFWEGIHGDDQAKVRAAS